MCHKEYQTLGPRAYSTVFNSVNRSFPRHHPYCLWLNQERYTLHQANVQGRSSYSDRYKKGLQGWRRDQQ